MAMRKMHFGEHIIVNDYMYMNEAIKSWKLENNYFLWIFSDITLSKSKESIIADDWVLTHSWKDSYFICDSYKNKYNIKIEILIQILWKVCQKISIPIHKNF